MLVAIAVLGLIRIALQHACVSLGEWIVGALHDDPRRLSAYTSVDLSEFRSPADGSLVSLLSQLLVATENIGWKQVGRHYWQQFEYPSELKRLTGASKGNIETVLLVFIQMRNDGGEGHGLPGGYPP